MATMFEFDESDIWSSSNHHHQHHISSDHHQNQFKKPIRSQKSLKKTTDHHRLSTTTTTGSLPVNVPDWAKILRQEQRREQVYDDDESDDDEDCGNKRIPPHEFLAKQFARTRVCAASFSVHEGIGRTLKGRDLSRVRNAIWEKTGFED